MMRPLIALLLSASVLALAPAATPDHDADEIKAAMVQMWAAIEAGDVDRYATFVHPDFTQFGETDAYLGQGKAAEVHNMAVYLQRAKSVHTEMHNPIVTVRGDVAWVTYYWSDEALVDGKRVTSRGKSTRIYVREGGKWLCIHGHYTLAP